MNHLTATDRGKIETCSKNSMQAGRSLCDWDVVPAPSAENLQKQGGFTEGVRPGLQTEKYLLRTMNRLILFGCIVLGTVSILPFIAEYLLYQLTGVTGTNLSIGGTGVLIVVSVALEALRQINSRALMVTYDGYK